MTLFDILLVANLALLAVALVRQRPAAFIYFANQVSVIRAFQNIESFGPPASMLYLPGSLFATSALATAASIFLVATCISVIMVVLPSRKPSADLAKELTPLPWWLTYTLGAYFIGYVFSKKTIFTAAYGVDGFVNFGLEFAGLSALLQGLVLYELYRRVITGSLKRTYAFAFIAGFALVVHFFKGQTGFASGFVITSAFFLLAAPTKRMRATLNIAAAVVVCLITVVLVRGIRAEFHTRGLETVDDLVQLTSTAEDDRARTGQGLEARSNGTQNAAHVLMCVKLFESGVDREWRSITQSVAYTFQPSFLQEPLGFERPLDATWELATHFIHGGGIHLLADLYWNGGYLCVVVMMLLISVWIALCDTRFATSFWWLMLACMFTPPSLMGVGYGFNHFARGIFNGLIVVSIVVVARMMLKRSEAGRTPPQLAAPGPLALTPPSVPGAGGDVAPEPTRSTAATTGATSSAPSEDAAAPRHDPVSS